MHYNDLVQRTATLSLGRHTIYALADGAVEIVNLGVRHPFLSLRPEFRLYIRMGGREMTPRHSDLFADYLLKIEVRPDLRLPLSEACEHVCNGASPVEEAGQRRLPGHFSEFTDATWTLQNSMYQTGGLPTEVFLCGLQGLIRAYELNHAVPNAPEAFRYAFLALEKGTPLLEVVNRLRPAVMPGKRYFDRLVR